MEVLITGTNTRVMWEKQPRTREVWLGVGVKMEAAAAAAAAWSEATPVDQLSRWGNCSPEVTTVNELKATRCHRCDHNTAVEHNSLKLYPRRRRRSQSGN